MIYPKHFTLQELVYPKLYEKYKGNKEWLLWRKFNPQFLLTLDTLRDEFGIAVVNNWSLGKISWLGNQIFQYSGVRPEVAPEGEYWSPETMHTLYNTADVKFKKCSDVEDYNKIRKFICDHTGMFPFVTVLEKNINWLHFSTGNFENNNGSIRMINR